MKIAVCIPAFQNPVSLNAVLYSFAHLESGENEVDYIVGVDADDAKVKSQIQISGPLYVTREAPPSVGEKSNRLFHVAARRGAEAFCWIADDVLPLQIRWDVAVPIALKETEVFCWNELSQQGHPTYPVFSRAYMEAVEFKPFPEYFPYWFIDTWMAEVYAMAFGRGVPVLQGLDLGGKRGKTRGLRDLRFWYQFFIDSRRERIAQAGKVADAYGRALDLPWAQFKEWDENVAQVLTKEHLAAEDYSVPSDRYRRAKSIVEAWYDNRKVA